MSDYKEEMITLLMNQLVKDMAMNKGKNTDFQKSDGVGKTLLEKYDNYQRAYVNHIKPFFLALAKSRLHS
jgi:hypothetical protein